MAWLALALFAGIGYELLVDGIERFQQAKTITGALFSLALHSLVILAMAGACFLNFGKMCRPIFFAPNAQKAKYKSRELHRDLAARAKSVHEAAELAQILLSDVVRAENADHLKDKKTGNGAEMSAQSRALASAKPRRV